MNEDMNMTENNLPQIEANETMEAHEEKNVQLSMDPSIQKEEEAKLAQKENDVKLKAILEGLLFLVGDDGLTVEQASKSMDISTKKAEQLFDALQKEYVDDSRGFEIERYGSRYRFLSKAFVHEAAKKLFSIDKISKLSNAALETLAIIAYKQPITRVEIEEIRGVGADVMIRKLEARGLIKEEGRSDAPGRPFLYSVTDEFMDAFKLLSLDELPDLPEFNKDNNDDLFHS
ncbi:SMC-Scp complex subunit ScpB [Bulleidia sp. HCP3S3_F2]|uniref:SMC-Scp complex subunit ScpB n=1 Tax=unclassified Bulleidia TaxID=2704656 RepID=UPI002A8B5BA4|nr:SMC-Scp complex subunit ScpB [Bulleidia sp.]